MVGLDLASGELWGEGLDALDAVMAQAEEVAADLD